MQYSIIKHLLAFALFLFPLTIWSASVNSEELEEVVVTGSYIKGTPEDDRLTLVASAINIETTILPICLVK